MKFFCVKKNGKKLKTFKPFFHGKKGASIILMITAVIVVTFIVFMVNDKAASYSKSDPILKEYIANDLVLMINTLMIPGNVIIQYPEDLSGYNFILNSKEVSVYRKDEAIINRVEKSFILPKGYKAAGNVEGKAKVCLKKDRKVILLEECK